MSGLGSNTVSQPGGETPASTYSPDKTSLAQFLQTTAGQQYATSYDPGANYWQQGSSYYSEGPKSRTGTDVTAMMTAYNQWESGAQQVQLNWTNYAETVKANAGGEGDNTITTGAAVGQRQQLLGALANAGNTTPTPGLGVMGAPGNGNVENKYRLGALT